MSYPVTPPPPPGDGPVPPPAPGAGAGPQPPREGFGQAPGSPPEQQGLGPAPESAPDQGFGPAPAPPQEKVRPPASKVRKVLLGVLGVVLVALVIGALKFGLVRAVSDTFFGDKAADAKVGDCLGQLPEPPVGETKEVTAKVVDCAAGDAAYVVVGRVENQTREQAEASEECARHVKEGEEYPVYSNIPQGGTGYVLCLKPKS